MLEENVDTKFYLNQEQVNKIKFSTYHKESSLIQTGDYSDTLCARGSIKCVQIGRYDTATRVNSNCYRVYDDNGLSPTLSTYQGGNLQPFVLDDNTLVRKLTPKECWRLMGFTDGDFDKATKVCSNSQLYKQAGNSIVVSVLENILRNLFKRRDDGLIIYDCEVFKHDWIVVFKDSKTGSYIVIHNDNEALKMAINNDDIYIGFNSKHYDQYIIKAIAADFTPEEVKKLNDYIMGGGQGWEYPPLQGFYFNFNNIDIRDDMQQTLSLKSIEGHLGLPIKESNVDFNIDHSLSEEELEEVIKYCKYDVDSTEKIVNLREDYLKTKANLGKRAGIDVVNAMAMTNAKLTAKMLGAKFVPRDDGREYVYPDNLDKSVIPTEILEFFDTIHDESIDDEELFKTSLDITLGDMPCTYAWGGVHGSQSKYYEESTDTRVIQNRDVSSLYPTIIEEYQYLSRNVADANLYYQMRKDRMTAKHTSDKQTAKDLKLPLNTVSGAQENKFNELYDPLPTRSLRISGQLFLTVLTMRLLNACKSIKLLNLNTDGLMYSVDKAELPIVDEICATWETETRFELETDEISKVWIKDVNNLLLIKTNGAVKTVGGYLNYGISEKGAWGINNNMVIVKKALIEYFVNGTPIEDTVNNSNDIFDFQIVAKAGSKYSRAYQLVNGDEVPVQKVNRVYSTSDTRYGTIIKVKAVDGSKAKIENLPEHCIIDNENQLTIDDIDKEFYINLAKKRLNDFTGEEIEEEEKMATKKATEVEEKMAIKKAAEEAKGFGDMNVYMKLILAREMFLSENVQKSGKNMHLAFKYFELDDIVPIAIKIFARIGLLPMVNFFDGMATMDIINTDKPDEFMTFKVPFNPLEPIVSKEGKNATNAMQALGSSITYMRRYLYMMVLDICEADSIDANMGSGDSTQPAKSTVPATPTQRGAIKDKLTGTKDQASELQIKSLKAVLKKLKEADPSKEEIIGKIAIQTKSFTDISKSDCEKLIQKITGLLGEVA
jgi:DNA polymerase elongation subunit (family B)|nr:MAG TPA: DNA polymerase [Caudoviricetes sp.]